MRTKNWSRGRIFSGRHFRKLVAPKSKTQAQKIAKIQRRRGYNARVTPIKDSYTGKPRYIVWRSVNRYRRK